jgi:putative salt-induced outer membrane protein
MCVLLPGVALAQAAPPPTPPAVGGSLDLGYVSATGNTSLKSFSLGEKLTVRASSRLHFIQTLRSVYGKANDSVTANSLAAVATGDYTFFEGLGFTAGVGYDRDRFAGIDRRTEESFGLVWRFASHTADSLRVETSAVWTQKRGVDSIETHFTSARLAIWYKRPVGTTGAYFQEAFESLPNFDVHEDWRINSETAVVAPVSRHLSLKLAYLIKYDNLPEPTFRKDDRLLTAGAQINY